MQVDGFDSGVAMRKRLGVGRWEGGLMLEPRPCPMSYCWTRRGGDAKKNGRKVWYYKMTLTTCLAALRVLGGVSGQDLSNLPPSRSHSSFSFEVLFSC